MILLACCLAAVLLLIPAFAQKRYELKSGILQLISYADGHEMQQTQYFDNYGASQAVTYIIDIPGLVKQRVWAITQGNRAWMVTTQLAAKSKAKEIDNPLLDLTFISPSAEVVEKYKIKELRKEEFLGRECTVFNYDQFQNRKRYTVTAWVYKGVILKQEYTYKKSHVISVTTELKENVPVPAEIFDPEK